jgi:hypothetical protein
MFHLPMQLTRADKWRRRRLTRFGKSIGFNQKEFTFP